MRGATVAGAAAVLGVAAAVGLAVAYGPDAKRYDPVAEPFARRVAQLETAYDDRGGTVPPAPADGLAYLAASGPIVATGPTVRWSVVLSGCFRGSVQPLLAERDRVVVVAGRAVGITGFGHPDACHSNLVAHEVSARLQVPLGARSVVDAVTGRTLSTKDVVNRPRVERAGT